MNPTPPGDYWDRRRAIAALAAGPHAEPRRVQYTSAEHGVWRAVHEALAPAWDQHAAPRLLAARDELRLSPTVVPQLADVTAALAPLTGFRYEAMPGLVDKETFFSALAENRFLSTQYLRWEGSPLYTPEPDVIHEVFGHAHLLAVPELAELHRLAGRAVRRLETAAARQAVADVFWFSGEFGVVGSPGAWKAYGAGLLSSYGELGWFADNADVRALDIGSMATLPYDITRYQPVLFGARSLHEVLDVVGGFFADCTDDTVLAAAQRHDSAA